MNAKDVLMYGHLWVHKHLEGLTPQQWTAPDVCGVWSVKDIIAHLTSYEWLLVEVFRSCLGPVPTPVLDEHNRLDGDSFNALQVGKRQADSPERSLIEYDDSYAAVMEVLPLISKEILAQPGTLPWYGSEYSMEDFIVYQYYGHKREHMAQVAIFRDQLRAAGELREAA